MELVKVEVNGWGVWSRRVSQKTGLPRLAGSSSSQISGKEQPGGRGRRRRKEGREEGRGREEGGEGGGEEGGEGREGGGKEGGEGRGREGGGMGRKKGRYNYYSHNTHIYTNIVIILLQMFVIIIVYDL